MDFNPQTACLYMVSHHLVWFLTVSHKITKQNTMSSCCLKRKSPAPLDAFYSKASDDNQDIQPTNNCTIARLGNPKLYKELQDKSMRKQVDVITKILNDNGVQTKSLNEETITKLKQEFALKHEMKELGIDVNDPVSTSPRKPRRNIKGVSYAYKNDEQEEEVDSE
eukprot:74282_1